MPRLRVVLDMCRGDCDTTLPLLRCLINCAIFEEIGQALLSLSLRNSSGQGSLIKKHQYWHCELQASNECAHLAMIDVTNGACSNQLQLSFYCSLDVVPMLTWGFDRSKTVARPRIPFASLPKTCCTGLPPLCCRTASRLVRSNGANERVMTTILSHFTQTPENKERREMKRTKDMLLEILGSSPERSSASR